MSRCENGPSSCQRSWLHISLLCTAWLHSTHHTPDHTLEVVLKADVLVCKGLASFYSVEVSSFFCTRPRQHISKTLFHLHRLSAKFCITFTTSTSPSSTSLAKHLITFLTSSTVTHYPSAFTPHFSKLFLYADVE